MIKKIIRTLALLSVFLALPVLAQPVVTGVIGTVTHDASVNISGYNFGTKTTAVPYIYDNFETGALGTMWNWGYMPSCRTPSITAATANQRHEHSLYAAYYDLSVASACGWAQSFFSAPHYPTSNTAWYGQYWFMLCPGWVWMPPVNPFAPLDNIKLYRDMTNLGGNQPGLTFAFNPLGVTSKGVLTIEFDVAGNFTNENDYNSPMKEMMTPGVWHLIQFERVIGTPGVADGWARMWLDGRKMIEARNRVTGRNASESAYSVPQFGFNDSHNSSGVLPAPHVYYTDEEYLDNTLCRVEIGNNQNYELCTHREIQLPTAWNTEHITAKVNMGSFPSTAGLYLFVVNSAGVASEGRLLAPIERIQVTDPLCR